MKFYLEFGLIIENDLEYIEIEISFENREIEYYLKHKIEIQADDRMIDDLYLKQDLLINENTLEMMISYI